jgi:ABC-type long-subunit fatty acid transport system fused permease/ATPase subunit
MYEEDKKNKIDPNSFKTIRPPVYKDYLTVFYQYFNMYKQLWSHGCKIFLKQDPSV